MYGIYRAVRQSACALRSSQTLRCGHPTCSLAVATAPSLARYRLGPARYRPRVQPGTGRIVSLWFKSSPTPPLEPWPVPATQMAMSSSLYWQLNWPCHPPCTSHSNGHVIIYVLATTQLAISSYLYRPINLQCHPLCTSDSTGHVIQMVMQLGNN